MTRAKISLKANGGGSIVVGGIDIANAASAITIEARGPGRGTTASVRMELVEALDVDAEVRVDDRTRTALLALGWQPPAPKVEDIGDATVEVGPDGTRVVTRADDMILVAPELLAEMEKLGNYVDNVFTLDTAGEYRYRYAGDFGPNAVFERITTDEQETPA